DDPFTVISTSAETRLHPIWLGKSAHDGKRGFISISEYPVSLPPMKSSSNGPYHLSALTTRSVVANISELRITIPLKALPSEVINILRMLHMPTTLPQPSPTPRTANSSSPSISSCTRQGLPQIACI